MTFSEINGFKNASFFQILGFGTLMMFRHGMNRKMQVVCIRLIIPKEHYFVKVFFFLEDLDVFLCCWHLFNLVKVQLNMFFL